MTRSGLKRGCGTAPGIDNVVALQQHSFKPTRTLKNSAASTSCPKYFIFYCMAMRADYGAVSWTVRDSMLVVVLRPQLFYKSLATTVLENFEPCAAISMPPPLSMLPQTKPDR